MERNIIQLAKSTLVVSLPKAWLEKQGIHKGDKVSLDEKEDRIVIRSGKKKKASIALDIKKGQTFTSRHVADLYIRGFDEVKISFKDESVMRSIEKEDLLGFEIVERSKQYVVIRNVASGIEDELDTMLRRSFILCKEMGAIVSKGKLTDEDVEELLSLENMVNKFTSFCKRVLNKNGYHPAHKMAYLYVIAKDLEVVGDIYKYIIQDTTTLNKKETAYILQVNEYVQQLYDLFYTFDEKIVTSMGSHKEKLLKEGRELVKKGSIVGHHGLDLVLLVTSMKGPIITMNF